MKVMAVFIFFLYSTALAGEVHQNPCGLMLASVSAEPSGSGTAHSFLMFIKKLAGQRRIGKEEIEALVGSALPIMPAFFGMHPIETVSYSKGLEKLVGKLTTEDWLFIRERLKDFKNEMEARDGVEQKNRFETKKIILPKLVFAEQYPEWVKNLKRGDYPQWVKNLRSDGAHSDLGFSFLERSSSVSPANILAFYENLSWKLAGEIQLSEDWANFSNVRAISYGQGKTAVFGRVTLPDFGKGPHNTVVAFDLASGQRLTLRLPTGWFDHIDTYQPFEFEGKFYSLIRDAQAIKVVDLQNERLTAFGWIDPNSQAIPAKFKVHKGIRSIEQISHIFSYNKRPAFAAVGSLTELVAGKLKAVDHLVLFDAITGEVLHISDKVLDIPWDVRSKESSWHSHPIIHFDSKGEPLVFLKYREGFNKNGTLSRVYIRNLLTGEDLGDFTFTGNLLTEIEFHQYQGLDYGIAVTEREILVFQPESGLVWARTSYEGNESFMRTIIEPSDSNLGRVHLFTSDQKHLIFDLMSDDPTVSGSAGGGP